MKTCFHTHSPAVKNYKKDLATLAYKRLLSNTRLSDTGKTCPVNLYEWQTSKQKSKRFGLRQTCIRRQRQSLLICKEDRTNVWVLGLQVLGDHLRLLTHRRGMVQGALCSDLGTDSHALASVPSSASSEATIPCLTTPSS